MISHYPTKELKQHILEVQNAAKFLLSLHSAKLKKSIPFAIFEFIIAKHDEGKKTEYFQEYIKSPDNFNGNKQLKRHSKLSTLLALSDFNNSDILSCFQILECIGGHHTKLKSLDELICYWSASESILKKQIFKLPISNVSKIDINAPSDFIYELIEDKVKSKIKKQSKSDALYFRLQTQLIYSLLLESDKALLAVNNYSKHTDFIRNIWQEKWIDDFIGKPKQTLMNGLRNSIRDKMSKQLKFFPNSQINTLTSPTGSGKTLLAATWALNQRKKLHKEKEFIPKIIIVLPFLSIINQTVGEYQKILTEANIDFDGSWITESHSLSERNYSIKLSESEESFFIDTWRSDVIITTYDQFLYSIFNSKSKHQMRFHNVMDSIIVLDEVQSLPIRLWRPLNDILYSITKFSESRILLMSATMPKFISDSNANALLPDYKIYFKNLNRYEIDFSLMKDNNSLNVNEFCENIKDYIPTWINQGERVLLTFNTRKSAQDVYLKLKKIVHNIDETFPLFFISSDVVPTDRIYRIEKIRNNERCIVISTQSIEAGVDIDMTKVYRDFAPLDSLIQIAGRCNRNAKYTTPKKIKITQIKSENGRLFSEMIYDEVHLWATRETLKNTNIVFEKDIIKFCDKYFKLLSQKTNTGESYINKFAFWKEYENIRKVLRADEVEKYEFCLLDRDLALKEQIKKIAEIKDRWVRRERFRRLSGHLAKLTVSVIAKKDFFPGEIANNYYGFWNLKKEFYNSDIGIVVPNYNKITSLIL